MVNFSIETILKVNRHKQDNNINNSYNNNNNINNNKATDEVINYDNKKSNHNSNFDAGNNIIRPENKKAIKRPWSDGCANDEENHQQHFKQTCFPTSNSTNSSTTLNSFTSSKAYIHSNERCIRPILNRLDVAGVGGVDVGSVGGGKLESNPLYALYEMASTNVPRIERTHLLSWSLFIQNIFIQCLL
ncbi:hypothetical protein HELRODRAFT_173003 [Helobdella robusta]|uniref:Uncharacterized protein n=1 Tax=Helobdella robusta TaxID=6412 RepID=T1F694_HELRO|nr:hypothetical protein HELRODRAFT_173003 [Helobdella robusta]ESO03964.1 hypothetical protein HELRODRAFT_173003 [Helobdella robusta]